MKKSGKGVNKKFFCGNFWFQKIFKAIFRAYFSPEIFLVKSFLTPVLAPEIFSWEFLAPEISCGNF